MKKSQSNEEKPPKKENVKGKAKDNQKSDKKEKPKDKKKEIIEEEFDFYTPEEIALLDKFHEFSNKQFEDDEIYNVMQKFNNDEELIKKELKEMLKVLSKGEEYNWTEIGKSEFIYFYYIINIKIFYLLYRREKKSG